MKRGSVKVPEADWADLVQRAQAGDGDAYTELFQQLHTPVLNYVYRTMGDRPAAEDITQDAFIRAHQRIGQLGPPYDFKSWVFRIASNLAIDSLRQNKRYVDEEPMDLPGDMTTQRPAERKVQQAQARQSVQATLALMPTAYRQAIVLRELNGLGYQEVANALEVSYDNARQLVHRARLNFREVHGIRMLAASGAARCRALDDLLSALQDRELSKDDQKAVRKHIKSCEHCKETEKDLRAVAGLVAGLTPILPSPGWVEGVVKHLQGQSGQAVQSAGMAQGSSVGGGAGTRAGSDPAGSVAVRGSSWIAKFGAGAAIALIGAGALIAAGAWAYNRLINLPPNPLAVEQTVRAAIDLTPAAPISGQEEGTPAPAILPPAPPTATPSTSPAGEDPILAGPPVAVALVNSNCRAGPGGIYGVLDYLLADQQTPIVGRDAAWNWWVVEKKNSPGTCWIANNLTDELGDTSLVPVVAAPPTPTPVDDQAPMLALSFTPNNPLSNDPITFNVRASDAGGIAWIEIWVRPPGQNVASLLGTCRDDMSCSVIGGPYTAGQGQFFARSEDKAGNFTESSVLTFDVSWYIG